ncbi:hypothetical protein [Agrobacterium deltaense]|uniref:hypothetical protein n=1 Tax=Agrobacterium deltaense TaxID=1183412 RepID=UPI0009BACDE6|nr:hypothetical protein [Agrobacterium deltaense]CUX08555.1 hypothetical protein AGR7B_Cc10158 [Agrobacterium deltaense RV3]
MPKKLHPADAADRAKIATAAHFNVHLRRSPTNKINREAATLADAAKIADEITAEFKKAPMVYAITPDKMTVFVPKEMVEAARGSEETPAVPMQRKAAGKRAAALEAAQRGVLPNPPDFTAATHRRFRPRLVKLIELVEAGDIDGLKAIEINPVSSSPKAMARYRQLAVIALLRKERVDKISINPCDQSWV